MADPRNPDIEAALLDRPDDPELWSVYADWLEEQGDVRGELLRLPDGDETRRQKMFALYPTWFEGVPFHAFDLRWKHTFVSLAHARTANRDIVLRALAAPSMRFVRCLDLVARDFALTGLETLLHLRDLTLQTNSVACLQALPSQLPARLERLQLILKGDAAAQAFLDALIRLPALKELHVDDSPAPVPGLLRALRPVVARHARLHLFLTDSRADELSRDPTFWSGFGARLVLSAEEPVLDRHHRRLAAQLPETRFEPAAILPPGYRYTTSGALTVSEVPQCAPADYASIPPGQVRSLQSGEFTITCGVPTTHANAHWLRRCGNCASPRTLSIWHRQWKFRDPDTGEKYWVHGAEYVCQDCGKFTSYCVADG